MYKERSIRWSPFNKNQFFLAPIPYLVLTGPCLVLSDVSPALGSLPQFCVCFMHCYLKSAECKLYYRIYDLSTGGDKEADKAATEVDRVICQRLKCLLGNVILSYMSIFQMQNTYKISGWQELREFLLDSLNSP